MGPSTVSTTASAAPARAFFAAPAAVIMPLDEPVACPVLPTLTLQAIAAAPGAQHYLVITLDRPNMPTVTAHLGPDEETLAHRGLLLVAGLRDHRDISADLTDGAAVLFWLADCWAVMNEQFATASIDALVNR